MTPLRFLDTVSACICAGVALGALSIVLGSDAAILSPPDASPAELRLNSLMLAAVLVFAAWRILARRGEE
jgi:hypothetical protein